MSFIHINSTDEEKKSTLQAINTLVNTTAVKSMSQAMIAETADIKATKMRSVLQDVIDEGYVQQMLANENKKTPRYFYMLTKKGFAYLEQE